MKKTTTFSAFILCTWLYTAAGVPAVYRTPADMTSVQHINPAEIPDREEQAFAKLIAGLNRYLVSVKEVYSRKAARPSSGVQKKDVEETLKNLPVAFRKNMGQWDEKILYRSSDANTNVYLMKNGLSFGSRREAGKENEGEASSREDKHETLVWNMYFMNTSPGVAVAGEGMHDSRCNYLKGSDPSKHVVNAPDYEMVSYSQLYSGIDLRYYKSQTKLKYDFILAPHAEAGSIALQYEGIKGLNINASGQLEVSNEWGTVIEERPYSYQFVEGVKKEVRVDYRLIDRNTFGFTTGENYDPACKLIIDPITLQWATWVGSTIFSGGDDGYLTDMTVDVNGNIYGTGFYLDGFPTIAGSYDTSYNGFGSDNDAYVFKLSSDAKTLIYSTYIGGCNEDRANSIAISSGGEAFIGGYTNSGSCGVTKFPAVNAFQGTGGGSNDGFVSKLNASGTALVYSSYIGNTGNDYVDRLAVGAGGEAYLAGHTNSANFPVTGGAYDTSFNFADDIFITKVAAGGSSLSYSTFVGGTNYEIPFGMFVNTSGEVYFTGNTSSGSGAANPYPTTGGSYKPTSNAIGGSPDAVVTKLNAAGSAIVFSTFLGGSAALGNTGYGVAVNSADEVLVTGQTTASAFPVTGGSYDTSYNGSGDIFILKLNSAASGLVFSTFFGGTKIEETASLSVGLTGDIYVQGNTKSTTTTNDIPMTGGSYDSSFNASASALPNYDTYIAHFNSSASTLLYSTYYGGTGNDYSFNGTTPPAMNIYNCGGVEQMIGGITSHSDPLPVTAGVYQNVKGNGGVDQPYLFKLSDAGCTLPINLLYFNAKAVRNEYVHAEWSTSSETNNDFFTIERSGDGEHFESLAEVRGNGNSGLIRSYSYNDMSPLQGISYYRLKQTDYDGRNFYAPNTEQVNINPAGEVKVVDIFPNPAGENVTISMFIPHEMRRGVRISVSSVLGQVIMEYDITGLPAGIYNHLINSASWSSGVYFVTVSCGPKKDVRKIVVRENK